MRRQFRILAILATVMALASCNKGKINPIHDTKPVDTSFWRGNVTNTNGDTIETTVDAYFPLEEFRKLGEANDTAGQRAMVNKYRKVLTANVVAHYPQIKD